METTRLSSKGQVVLPRSIRAARAWRPGQAFSVENTAEGVLLRPLKVFAPCRLEDVAGCLRYNGPPKSLRDMEKAVEAKAKRRQK